MFSFRNAVKAMMAVGAFSAVAAWAQPTPAPTTGDLPCKEEADVNGADTVVSMPDADGYFSLYDGTFKGWFQSCKTSHSTNATQGGIFRLGTADGKPSIYTTQRGTNSGGLMMTNKKFVNYEIVLETWPDFNNDAGLFNRTTHNGRCFQTVLDYIGGAAIGGTWGEGGFPFRDFRPIAYGGNEDADVKIPGNDQGDLSNWTLTTKTLKANGTEPNLPCAASGCVAADWKTLWDKDGWNNIKIQFYGGSAANTGKVHMKSWFKKKAATVWVPLLQDTTYESVIGTGYIGVQVHGGGRFGGQKGTWYRDIKWKPLDNTGKPVPQSVSNRGQVSPVDRVKFKFSADANVLTGSIDQDYWIKVKDVSGRTVESFSGKAGKISHAFTSNVHGVLLLRIETSRSVESFSVVRALN